MNEKAIEAAAEAIKSRFAEAYPDQRHMLNPTLATELARAALPPLRAREEIARIKDRIDTSLNDYLCEMQPDYDDSIVGFTEAWGVVRKVFADALSSTAGQEWRDISSAKKDGTPLLGFMPTYYQGRGGQSVILWQDGAWWDNRAFKTDPSHWIPLPAPPVVEPIVAEKRTQKC